MQPVLFADDQQFWFETLRALGHTAYGGADINEVIAVSQRIPAGDYEAWYREWRALAERIEAEGRRSARHPITARDSFLRASNYFRSAEFFLHGATPDPRAAEMYERSVACFRAAVEFMPHITPVAIPFEKTTLSGYFYRSALPGVQPTVLMHSGFDGTCEEMHFICAAAAHERGYNVLVFDGPGQPSAIHRGMPFRPEWETVVTPVLDYLLAQPNIGPVALLGVSMGGLLAPRAAAFEHRLAACIAVDGVYDMGAISMNKSPLPREEVAAMLRAKEAPMIDAMIAQQMQASPTARWAIHHGMWVMGVKTPRAYAAANLDYTLAGIAENITCPTLVCEAEEDIFFAGQPKQLFDHLTCEKTFMKFTQADNAGAHCHAGAQRYAYARVFDWLDDTLRR